MRISADVLLTMDELQTDKLRQGRAYQAFYQEYEARLSFTQELLKGDIDATQRAELKRRFHMLKGGAGFFGFLEIARIAKEIELMLGGALASLDEQGKSELTQSLQLLESHYQQMPQPLEALPDGESDA